MSQADEIRNVIPPISVTELAGAAQPGAAIDKCSRQLLDRELETLSHRRTWHNLEQPYAEGNPNEPDHLNRGNLTGIALSGGGIRSATFCLGVLQALAKADLLKRFDYLSTVSGGGYIGSSLTWWLSEASAGSPWAKRPFSFGLDANSFPYGVDDAANPPPTGNINHPKDAGPHLLNYLRKHGKYLTPGGGINILSGISVGIRAVFLNLFVWIPLVTLALMFIQWYSWLLVNTQHLALLRMQSEDPNGPPGPVYIVFVLWHSVWITAIFAGLALLYYVLIKFRGWLRRKLGRDDAWAWCSAWWLWLPIVALSVAVSLALPPYYFQGYWNIILTLVVVYGILCLAFSFGTYVVSKLNRGHGFGYLVRRLSDMWAGAYVSVFVVLLIIHAVPITTSALGSWIFFGVVTPRLASFVFLLIVLLAIAALVLSGAMVESFLRARGFQISGELKAMLAAALLLYCILVLLNHWAMLSFGQESMMFWTFSIVVMAIASGFLTNINYISLGQFYRDRLMEAFMPAYDAAIQGRTEAASPEADSMRLHEASIAAPFHIINSNVVLVSAKDRRRRIRGGDSFILTRDYCGSNATGWRRTIEFMADAMSVPTAMAISGAAANPNTGVGGVGPTRNRLVSVLMALVNLRLGYWVPHPSKPHQNVIPNHFRPGLIALVRGYKEDYPFQELTDGGHFDNLGIYELIRRRLRLILVCDAAADPGFQFGDLQTALHRIKEDFGARIEFDFLENKYKIEDLIPRKTEDPTYPKGLEQAKRGFAVSKIHYASDLDVQGKPRPNIRPAWLIYLKSTIVPGLPLGLRGYKGREALFPNQSTGNQFFGEDQFEAYRQLGQRLAEAMIQELQLDNVDANDTNEKLFELIAAAAQARKTEQAPEQRMAG